MKNTSIYKFLFSVCLALTFYLAPTSARAEVAVDRAAIIDDGSDQIIEQEQNAIVEEMVEQEVESVEPVKETKPAWPCNVPGCKQCNGDTGTFCLSCVGGMRDSGGKCESCGDACQACINGTRPYQPICTQCDDGYYKPGGSGSVGCAPCPAGCAGCNKDGACIDCEERGKKKIDGKCVDKPSVNWPPGCISGNTIPHDIIPDEFECTECEAGKGITGKGAKAKCEPCPGNVPGKKLTCTACAASFPGGSNLNCTQCSASGPNIPQCGNPPFNCQTWTISGSYPNETRTCTQCDAGFGLVNGRCVSNPVPGCNLYEGAKCVSCSEGLTDPTGKKCVKGCDSITCSHCDNRSDGSPYCANCRPGMRRDDRGNCVPAN